MPSQAKSSDELRLRETKFFSPSECKQFGAVLDDLMKQSQARRRLKPLVYQHAAKIEQLLKSYSYDQVAASLSDRLDVLIKPETLKRYLNQWRTEQRTMEQDDIEEPALDSELQQSVSPAPVSARISAPGATTQPPPLLLPLPQLLDLCLSLSPLSPPLLLALRPHPQPTLLWLIQLVKLDARC